MSDFGKGVAATLLAPFIVPIALIAVAPLLALNGWAFMMLWGWFVVPLGASALGFWQATGLCVFGRFISTSQQKGSKEKSETPWVDFFSLLIRAPLVVAIGWLIHWMGSAS